MDKKFQNFLSLFTAVGTLCSFFCSVDASSRGTDGGTDYESVRRQERECCDTSSQTPKLPAKAYGYLPQGYQYFDVSGCGICGYRAVFLSFDAAINPSARHIELNGNDVTKRLGDFSNYVSKLRKRERLPLKVYEAFEKLVWEVVFHVQKDAFDLTEDDWKRFFNALAGGGVLLDAALLPFLAWWLHCDIIVMCGEGHEEVYSGVFPGEENVKAEDSKEEGQHSEQKKHPLIPENGKALKDSEESKSVEKNDDTKNSKIVENSDTSESSEEDSEEESENSDESDDSEKEDRASKRTIRVFYAQNGAKGHYWAVIPDYFQEIDEDKDLTGSARISLWRTVKKPCH